MQTKICPVCGKEFKRFPCIFKLWPDARCSRKCYGKTKVGQPKHDYSVYFWNKVTKSTECWLWNGARNLSGYGSVNIMGFHLAHRFAWFLTHGSIPDGIDVLHTCDNPPCVNPDHLFLGAAKENREDASVKGRLFYTAPKLDRGDAETIRQIYKGGGWTQKMIAEQFNVSTAHVSGIISGRFWKS